MYNSLSQILNRLEVLESTVQQLVRVGRVVSLVPERACVRVEVADADADGTPLTTYELPVLTRKSLHDKSYWMPDIGEHVLCIFLPFALRQGFVVSAFYSQADAPPVADNDVRHVEFRDGSWFQYNRREHLLSGHVVGGNATLTVDKNVTLYVGKDLAAEVGGNASVDVAKALIATAKTIEAKADQTISIIAPQIRQIGNITSVGFGSGGSGDTIGDETKRAHTTHEGSYNLSGDARIGGHLIVDSLTVRDPINGTLVGGG